LLIIKMFIMS